MRSNSLAFDSTQEKFTLIPKLRILYSPAFTFIIYGINCIRYFYDIREKLWILLQYFRKNCVVSIVIDFFFCNKVTKRCSYLTYFKAVY